MFPSLQKHTEEVSDEDRLNETQPLQHSFCLLRVLPVWLSCVPRTRNSWQNLGALWALLQWIFFNAVGKCMGFILNAIASILLEVSV